MFFVVDYFGIYLYCLRFTLCCVKEITLFPFSIMIAANGWKGIKIKYLNLGFNISY